MPFFYVNFTTMELEGILTNLFPVTLLIVISMLKVHDAKNTTLANNAVGRE